MQYHDNVKKTLNDWKNDPDGFGPNTIATSGTSSKTALVSEDEEDYYDDDGCDYLDAPREAALCLTERLCESNLILRYADDLLASSTAPIQLAADRDLCMEFSDCPRAVQPPSVPIPLELILGQRRSIKEMSALSTPTISIDDGSALVAVRAESPVDTIEYSNEEADNVSCSSDSSSTSDSSSSRSDSDSSSDEDDPSISSNTYTTILEPNDSDEESSLCSNECEGTVATNFTAQSLRLRRKEKDRTQELRRLAPCGRIYVNYLQGQESMVQNHARRRLTYLRRTSELAGNAAEAAREMGEDVTRERPRITLLQNLKRGLRFEGYHTLPGIAALSLYVIAHTACYEFFHHAHLALFSWAAPHWGKVYGATFLFGILLLRLSGGLFTWTSDTLYEGVKFDLHNKFRLQDWDARIMKWVRKRQSLRLTIDIVAVYLCFISVAYLNAEWMLPAVCGCEEALYADLPSRAYGVDTFARNVLTKRFVDDDPLPPTVTHQALLKFQLEDQCLSPSSLVDLKAALELIDAEYLYDRVSGYSFYGLYGWEGTAVVSERCYQSYTIIASITSMVALFKLGVGFWDD